MEASADSAVDGSAKGEGGGGGDTASRSKPPNLPWLSAKAWVQLLAYEATLGAPFAGLPGAIERASGEWKVINLEIAEY